MTPTIHLYAEGEPQGSLLYVWNTGEGHAYLLGDKSEIAALHAALTNALAGNIHPEPISEYDPVWGMNTDIPGAVREAISYGLDGEPAQIADSIRAAARRGAIRGASVVDGKWSIPKRTLRGWLVRTETERRGRPRQ